MTPADIVIAIIIGVGMAIISILFLCLFTAPAEDVIDKLTEAAITHHIKRRLKKKEKQKKSKRD